jgi:hypothetical protein
MAGSEREVIQVSRFATGVPNVWKHVEINHTISYVEGNVHTNGLDNFWSLLKRCLRGLN